MFATKCTDMAYSLGTRWTLSSSKKTSVFALDQWSSPLWVRRPWGEGGLDPFTAVPYRMTLGLSSEEMVTQIFILGFITVLKLQF